MLLSILSINAFSQNINQATYSNPSIRKIIAIEVRGTKSLDESSIQELTGLRVGDDLRIPGGQLDGVIDRLWAQGIVADVKLSVEEIDRNGIVLVIEIDEWPRLDRFTIEGLKKKEREKITKELPLIRGQQLNNRLIDVAKRKIIHQLEEKGYYGATIEIKKGKGERDGKGIGLIFKISKGKKLKVDQIEFRGNLSFKDRVLKKQFEQTHEKGLKNLFHSGRFKPGELAGDLNALKAFYQRNGHADIAILDDTVIYNYKKGTVDIHIALLEGSKYAIRNINWNGNYTYSDGYLDTLYNIRKGDIYNPELIDQKLHYDPKGEDVSSLYMDRGHLFFNANYNVARIDGDSVDLEIEIYEGPKARINNIVITGNSITSDRVILREIRTLPGNIFSRKDVIRTQRELSQLGYFDPEQIQIMSKPNESDGTVDIEYSLVERSSDQFMLSGGWGGSVGLVGTAGVQFNNFSTRNLFKLKQWKPLPMGDGQKLAFNFQSNGQNFNSYSIAFTEPWLGDRKPNALSWNVSRSRQNIDVVSEDADGTEITESGSLKLTGVSVGLTRRIEWPDDYFSLRHAVSFRKYTLNNFDSDLGFSDGDVYNFSFNTTLARNSIDNPTYPRRGSQFSLSLDLTPPYSLFSKKDYDELANNEKFKWSEYHKWMLDYKKYIKVAGNLVLTGGAHTGFIGSFNQSLGVGPFERFYMGGSGLTGQNILLANDVIGLRGYEDNSLVPYDADNDISGGLYYTKFNAELRYPISLNPMASIYVLGFAEAGNTTNTFNGSLFNLRKSAGVGLRFITPAFGQIGLDWGYGFDKAPGATKISGSQIHFTIGFPVR